MKNCTTIINLLKILSKHVFNDEKKNAVKVLFIQFKYLKYI